MGRKYGHRGYQDDESPKGQRGGQSGGRPERSEGPRGRGLGRPGTSVFRCRDCGEKTDPSEITLDSQCKKCKAALHACVNCTHFDPSARLECRQELTEPVRSKAKSNKCELFAAKVVAELGESSGPADAKAARAAFDALFE